MTKLLIYPDTTACGFYFKEPPFNDLLRLHVVQRHPEERLQPPIDDEEDDEDCEDEDDELPEVGVVFFHHWLCLA
jgi:hypothetical protein